MDDDERVGKEITVSFNVDDVTHDAGVQAVLDALVEEEKDRRPEDTDVEIMSSVLFGMIITYAEFRLGNGDPKLGGEKVDMIMDEGMRKWREEQQNDGDDLLPGITP